MAHLTEKIHPSCSGEVVIFVCGFQSLFIVSLRDGLSVCFREINLNLKKAGKIRVR